MDKKKEDKLDKSGPSPSSRTEGLDLKEEVQKKLEDIALVASDASSEDDEEWNRDPAPGWIGCGCQVLHLQVHDTKCKKQNDHIPNHLAQEVRRSAFCAKIRKLEQIWNCQVESEDKGPKN